MKRASRFMPKYIADKTGMGITAWVILLFFIAGFTWATWRSPILIIVILIIAIGSIYSSKKSKKKFLVLAEERKDLSLCEFACSFDSRKVDTWVIRAVYEQVQSYVAEMYVLIAIKADDTLFDLLEIDDEDLDLDLVEEIAQRTGRSLDDAENNPYYGKVNSVSDLVYFFNEQSLVEK